MSLQKMVYIMGLVVVVIMGYFLYSQDKPKETIQDKKIENKPIILITPPPTPPEPIPKKDNIVPEEETMVEQKPVDKIEEPEKGLDSPEPLGTNIGGDGPDMGLSRNAGNKSTGIIGRSKSGGKWDGFAVLVQNTIGKKLNENTGLRTKPYSVIIKIWVEPDGSITRCSLKNSTGSPLIDKELKHQIISKIKLNAPPNDMPMPITIRISSK